MKTAQGGDQDAVIALMELFLCDIRKLSTDEMNNVWEVGLRVEWQFHLCVVMLCHAKPDLSFPGAFRCILPCPRRYLGRDPAAGFVRVLALHLAGPQEAGADDAVCGICRRVIRTNASTRSL